MVLLTLENSITIISTVKESIPGQIIENMKETGELIKCMEKEPLTGPMEGSMSVSILRTRRKAMVNSFGLTVDATEESG